LEKNFKNFIVSSVKSEEKSISRLARELEHDGYKMHRLYLAGYLKALADVGILKEKEIPPSKVYTTTANLEKTIYEVIGEKCKTLKIPDEEKTRVAAYILQKLFKRPIFLQEITLCGLDGGIVGTKTGPEEKEDLRNQLIKTGLMIPKDDPAYVIEDRYEEEFEKVILTVILESYEALQLIVDTRQVRLDDARIRNGKKQASRKSKRPKKKA
jgi:DNA-binding HxlR family transcriptional regulator